MTNKQILKKAIEKAEKNGWINEEYDTITKDGYITKIDFPLKYAHLYEIIFSHDFAKAFWGEEKLIKNSAAPTGYMNKDDDPNKGTWGWQYYLSQMVLEKEPIKYLEKFL